MSEWTVLLHGMGRTSLSMRKLRKRLEALGRRCLALDYPSRFKNLAELGAHLTECIHKELGSNEKPCVITHSMGGVVVRFMPEQRWQRLVLLAPPSQGSQVAQRLLDNRFFQRVFGPAGQEVAVLDAPALRDPFAVVAGTRRVHPGNPISWVTHALEWIPRDEPSDGLILVRETRLAGMADFATIDATHTHIMNHESIPAMAVRFFETGRLEAQG